MANYYQPEIETMPVEQIQALQSERLAEQVKFVYDNVKFYHDKMDELGVKPDDVKGIEDLHKLPFIERRFARPVPVRTAGRAALGLRAHPVHERYNGTPRCGILHTGGYRCVGGVLCACDRCCRRHEG